jgi:hypothetical protein
VEESGRFLISVTIPRAETEKRQESSVKFVSSESGTSDYQAGAITI